MSSPGGYNDQIIEEFRTNGGKVGGRFEGAPLLLLHTRGARSEEERISPMMYLQKGDTLHVFASKGGADTNPDWYHNLVAHPGVTVEIGTGRIEATAEVLEGDERERIFRQQATLYPGFAEYEAKTTRVIPVVALHPKP